MSTPISYGMYYYSDGHGPALMRLILYPMDPRTCLCVRVHHYLCSDLISDPNCCDRVVDVMMCSYVVVCSCYVFSTCLYLSWLFRFHWGPILPFYLRLMTCVHL